MFQSIPKYESLNLNRFFFPRFLALLVALSIIANIICCFVLFLTLKDEKDLRKVLWISSMVIVIIGTALVAMFWIFNIHTASQMYKIVSKKKIYFY